MSHTLLRRINDTYDSDIKRVMDLNKDVMDKVRMIDRMRLLMRDAMKRGLRWWRMDQSDLGDIIICGILDDSTHLSAEMFVGMTSLKQSTDDNEYCIGFHFYGIDMVGDIHITVMNDKVYVIYSVIYEDKEYSTLWWMPYEIILEDKGLS